MSSRVQIGTSLSENRAKWRVALQILRPRQQGILALLACTRIAVGACDLLLASATYWLFVLLQGSVTVHRFTLLPNNVLWTAVYASIVVLVRALLDIYSSRSVFRQIQILSSDFLLRLTRGYSGMDWQRFVERNRSELSGHAIYTSREAADFYHRCIELISIVVTITIMAAALVYQSPIAAAVFGSALALFYLLHRTVVRNDITRAASDREGILRVLQRVLADLFSAGKEIRTYGNYSFFHERVRFQAERFAACNQQTVFLPQVSRIIAEQGTMLLFLGFIIAVEFLRGDTRRLIAVLAFYFVLSRRVLPLISQLSMILGQMESSYENVRVLDAELRECRECEGEAPSLQPPHVGSALTLKDLSFWYSRSDPILQGVNLCAAAGEVIVLCGPSGCGKSSLLNLIAGILSPSRGTVSVDRQSLAYVPQEITLLDASIRQNLLFGRSNRSDDELMDALRITRLDAFVQSQPQGLDTRVGDNGALFSGGERQRIGIARAILRRSRLLLLDEATSALDTSTEQYVLANLRASGATIVLATHRIHNLAFADRVFHLEAGRIIEESDHHIKAETPPLVTTAGRE